MVANSPSSIGVTWVWYSADTALGPWTLDQSIPDTLQTSGWQPVETGLTGLLEAGRFYALGLQSDGAANFSVHIVAPGSAPTAFGTFEGLFWLGAGATPPATLSTQPAPVYSLDYQMTTSTEHDGDSDGSPLCLDCDDDDGSNSPALTETCDGSDNNCNGSADEGLDTDADGDGHNTPGSCSSPNADCDDGNAQVNPGQSEDQCNGLDDDCSGATSDDPNADGDAASVCDNDCDDGNPARYPGNAELCDSVDSDCDGSLVDFFPNHDGDSQPDCVDPDDDNDGDPDGTDCADTDASRATTLPEITCNGIDDDCNLGTLDGPDGDADGWSSCGGDCADNDGTRYPGAPELCDGIDSNCVGATENLAAPNVDADLDGYTDCAGDCDDADKYRNPGAEEVCSGQDEDCDGLTDAADPDLQSDYDGDGFDSTCASGTDCDDSDPAVFPASGSYTSGLIKQCRPVVYPGREVADWHRGRLEQPEYFWDAAGSTHYLFFRGHYTTDQQALGFVTSTDGVTWSDVDGSPALQAGAPGSWDAQLVGNPSVVYAPFLTGISGPVPRPYLLFYDARSGGPGSDWYTGLATAVNPGGPHARLAPDGSVLTDAVLQTGSSGQLDSRFAHHADVVYDATSDSLDMWYAGAENFSDWYLFHASSTDGVSWTRTDGAGDSRSPDPLLQNGSGGDWDADMVKFPDVSPNPDPTATDDFEFFCNGALDAVGYVTGSDVAIDANPSAAILEVDSDSDRFDGDWTIRISRRFEESVAVGATPGAGTYYLYYSGVRSAGSSVYANGGGWVGYIANAVNHAPEIEITSHDENDPISSPATLSGTLADSMPDGVVVTLTALHGGSSTNLGAASVAAPADSNSAAVQSTTWTLSGATIPAGTDTILVRAENEGGVVRYASVGVNYVP